MACVVSQFKCLISIYRKIGVITVFLHKLAIKPYERLGLLRETYLRLHVASIEDQYTKRATLVVFLAQNLYRWIGKPAPALVLV